LRHGNLIKSPKRAANKNETKSSLKTEQKKIGKELRINSVSFKIEQDKHFYGEFDPGSG
jgi:hypothetical protein